MSDTQHNPAPTAHSVPDSDVDAQISSVEEILEDFRQGKMVVIVDDADRENEGDLVMAADAVSAADINFMARHGRGLICLTLNEDRCEQLGLELMTQNNNARYSTNFTVSIEAADGVSTGISAADRATTVQAAVRPEAVAADIVTPGHIFPIRAQAGGVLTRAGHTEAGIDLPRLAGRFPSSVICEVLNEDGTMARLPDLVKFGQEHGIKVGTIADLIRYRLKNEPTVIRLEQHLLESQIGALRVFAYEDVIDQTVHLALVMGEIKRESAVPVRVHTHTGIDDIVTQITGQESWSPDEALRYIAQQGQGVLVLLQYALSDGDLLNKLRNASTSHAQPAQATGGDPVDSDADLRMLGLGGQILADLGVGKMRVLGSQKRMFGLTGFDLEVIDYLPYAPTT